MRNDHPGDAQACIGLIAGMAIGASCEYYKRLATAFAREAVHLRLVLIHADLPKVIAYMKQRDEDSLGRYFAGIVHQLEDASATLAAITSVASHMGYNATSKLSQLPIISILDSVRDEIGKRGLRRVALFGSRFVMESHMYGALSSVTEVVPLREDEVTEIDTIYSAVVQGGNITSEQELDLTKIAHETITRERLDSIILAGTDLAVVYGPRHRPGFPSIDATDTHVEAILQAYQAQLLATD